VRVGEQLQLTYCTNIHPGESLDDVREAVTTKVAAVKRRVSPAAPFGVGLRLSARAAEALAAPGALDDFRRLLDAHGLYVFTINGFPYGDFHGTRVKERVYLPDWRDEARLAYTERLANLLAALLPDGVDGSISTVPGALRTAVDDAGVRAIAERVRRQAAMLARLRDQTGKSIALALEPEPGCLLETTDDTIAFFERHLFGGADEAVVRRHVGVCLDACHVAVAFEDPVEAVRRLRGAGIAIVKLQLSTALAVRFGREPEVARALGAFADDVYLHQVTERRGDGSLRRWLDLPEALAAAVQIASDEQPRQWRIHFHVPLFRAELGPFRNTQDELARLLSVVGETGCRHLEVETYTWDVLPPEYRREDVVDAIARELAWVQERL
jgi:sugar phosphate isomerase/epimerase